MFSKVTGGTLIFAVVVSLACFAARARQNPSSVAQGPDYQQQRAAVDLIRTINTAEMAYKGQGPGLSFAGWDDLIASSAFQTVLARSIRADSQLKDANFNDPSNILPGWRIRLFASNGASHYAVIVDTPPAISHRNIDVNPTVPSPNAVKACNVSYFSDDEGLIRAARAIDCPTPVANRPSQ